MTNNNIAHTNDGDVLSPDNTWMGTTQSLVSSVTDAPGSSSFYFLAYSLSGGFLIASFVPDVPAVSARAHYNRALMDSEGNVVPGAAIRIANPFTGATLLDNVMSTATGPDIKPNPWVSDDGIVDFYLDTPQRVSIGITTPCAMSEYLIHGADVLSYTGIPVPPTPPTPDPTVVPPLPAGWSTVQWADYFTGTAIDTAKWNIRNGTTQSNMKGMNFAANCSVAGGFLSIRSGLNVGDPAFPWTCGYLDTVGKSSFSSGRWESRMRFPWGTTAAGYWPAFWLMPDDYPPGYGEIDIMEAWPAGTSIAQTIHHDYVGTPPVHQDVDLTSFDPTLWHEYAVEKEAGSLKFFVDNVMVWDASLAAPWVSATFDRAVNWNIRLNLQIGETDDGGLTPGYGGWPTIDTDLSQTFDVDYVRVLGR
jgi:hypothetical protein